MCGTDAVDNALQEEDRPQAQHRPGDDQAAQQSGQGGNEGQQGDGDQHGDEAGQYQSLERIDSHHLHGVHLLGHLHGAQLSGEG